MRKVKYDEFLISELEDFLKVNGVNNVLVRKAFFHNTMFTLFKIDENFNTSYVSRDKKIYNKLKELGLEVSSFVGNTGWKVNDKLYARLAFKSKIMKQQARAEKFREKKKGKYSEEITSILTKTKEL